MADIKITLTLSTDVLSSARSFATRTGQCLDTVVNTALSEYVDARPLDGLMGSGDMSPEDAVALAIEETHAYRAR
jgi:hypothetical protein